MKEYVNQAKVFKKRIMDKVNEFLFKDGPEPVVILEVSGDKLELICCSNTMDTLDQLLAELIEEYGEGEEGIKMNPVERIKSGEAFCRMTGKRVLGDMSKLISGKWYELKQCPSIWSYPGYDLLYLGRDKYIHDSSEYGLLIATHHLDSETKLPLKDDDMISLKVEDLDRIKSDPTLYLSEGDYEGLKKLLIFRSGKSEADHDSLSLEFEKLEEEVWKEREYSEECLPVGCVDCEYFLTCEDYVQK